MFSNNTLQTRFDSSRPVGHLATNASNAGCLDYELIPTISGGIISCFCPLRSHLNRYCYCYCYYYYCLMKFDLIAAAAAADGNSYCSNYCQLAIAGHQLRMLHQRSFVNH